MLRQFRPSENKGLKGSSIAVLCNTQRRVYTRILLLYDINFIKRNNNLIYGSFTSVDSHLEQFQRCIVSPNIVLLMRSEI